MEIAFVFYNALIGVSTPKNIGRVSGFSWDLAILARLSASFLRLHLSCQKLRLSGLITMAEHVRITMPLAAVQGCLFHPFFIYVPEARMKAVLKKFWLKAGRLSKQKPGFYVS